MTPTRFADLAGAYGARLERWPPAERAAAARLLDTHPDAQLLLDAQRPLDAALDEWTVTAPPFLAEAIAARVLHRSTVVRRLQAWLTGFAAATALAGGAATGVTVASISALPVAGEVSSLYGLSVFGAPLGGADAESGDPEAGATEPGDPGDQTPGEPPPGDHASGEQIPGGGL